MSDSLSVHQRKWLSEGEFEREGVKERERERERGERSYEQ